MMLAVVVVVVQVAMTGDLSLEGQTFYIVAVVMMMGYDGMQHDNRTCHHNHYLCQQRFHTIDITSFGTAKISNK